MSLAEELTFPLFLMKMKRMRSICDSSLETVNWDCYFASADIKKLIMVRPLKYHLTFLSQCIRRKHGFYRILRCQWLERAKPRCDIKSLLIRRHISIRQAKKKFQQEFNFVTYSFNTIGRCVLVEWQTLQIVQSLHFSLEPHRWSVCVAWCNSKSLHKLA